MSKLYGMMVIRARISPDYFLDVMNWDDVKLLLDELEINSRDSWEQTRLQMWATLQSQSTKKIKPCDVLPFSWDQKDTVTEVTRNDVEEFKRRLNLT